ncbi:MAG: ABC transporter substrate-binding protein [Pseudomonadota bacterium]
MMKTILFAGWAVFLIMITGGLAQTSLPIRIGAIFSISGIAAGHNEPLVIMTQLAVDELNQKGGIAGRKVELMLYDNQSTAIGSVSAAQKAIQDDMMAVIGAHWSSHSLAMAPLLQEAGIPMISPGSTNPAVTQVGDYIFRACFLDSFQGRAMAKFAYASLGAHTAVIMKNINETYSITLTEFFSKAFTDAGGRISASYDYRGKAVDFAEILGAVKTLRPDVIYVPGYTTDSGLLIKQAVAMGIHSTFLGGDAWDEIDKVAGDALEGSYQSAPWHPEVPFKRSVHLKKVYQQHFSRDIENYSAPLAYDAVMLLADALERCVCTDKRKVRDQLAATSDFRGATGLIGFDRYGDPQDKEIIILKYEKGAFRYLKSIQP